MQSNDLQDQLLGSIIKTRLVNAFPPHSDIGPLVAERLRSDLNVPRAAQTRGRLASLRRGMLTVGAVLAISSAGVGIAGAASPAVRHVLRHVAEAVGIIRPAYSPVPFHVVWPYPSPGFGPGSPVLGLDDVAGGFIVPSGNGLPGSITARVTSGPPCPLAVTPCGDAGHSLPGFQSPPELQANADKGIPAIWFRFQAPPPGNGYMQIDEQATSSTALPAGQSIDVRGNPGSLNHSGDITVVTFIRQGTEVVLTTDLGASQAETEAQSLVANDQAQS
jgi:hypothetical protein